LNERHPQDNDGEQASGIGLIIGRRYGGGLERIARHNINNKADAGRRLRRVKKKSGAQLVKISCASLATRIAGDRLAVRRAAQSS